MECLAASVVSAAGAARRAALAALRAGLPWRSRRFLAGEGGDQIAAGEVGAGVALPGRTAAQLGGRKALLAQFGEK